MIRKAIRKRRRDLEITTTELARRVGVSRQHLVNIESGRENLSMPVLEKVMVELKLEIRPVDKAQ